MSSNLGRNKILNNQTKEVVYNVFLYVTSLRTNRETRPSLVKIKEEVSRATGVSFASISRIVKEAKDSERSGQPAFSREVQNKRKRKFYVTGLENEKFNAKDIRRIILEFHQNDCRLTYQALRKKLQEDYNWSGSDSSMRRIIRRLGFNWTKNDPQVLFIESGNESSLSEPDSVNMDCPIEDEEKIEEEPSEINWVEGIRSIIYESHQKYCRVTIQALKKKLQEDYNWNGSDSSIQRILQRLGFSWTKNDPQVLVAESGTESSPSEFDSVNMECPIEDKQKIEEEFSEINWKERKEPCDRVIKLEPEPDTVNPIQEMQRLTEEEFSKITTDDWKERCDRVIKLEAEYLKREYNVNVTVEDLVSDIKTEHESDAESDMKMYNYNGDVS